MRGVGMLLKSKTFNELFGLLDKKGEFTKLIDNRFDQVLQDVLSATTVPGTMWNVTSQGTRIVT